MRDAKGVFGLLPPEDWLSPDCRLPTSDGLTDGEPRQIEPLGIAARWAHVLSPVEWQAARFTLPASRLTELGPNFPREALGYKRVVPVEWQAAGDVRYWLKLRWIS